MSLRAWGKTGHDGEPSHHLAHHSMDVAAVLEQLLRQPVFAERLAQAAGRDLAESERTWLAAFAFLHDIGKLSPHFQAKAWPHSRSGDTRGHLEEGWRWLAGAVERSQAMGGTLHSLFEPLIASQAGEDWIRALFAHHGRPSESENPGRWPDPAGYDWRAEEKAMGHALAAWFPSAQWGDVEALRRPGFVHLFAGLLTLADWIGSDNGQFSHALRLDLDRYAVLARERAGLALERFGLAKTPWPPAEPAFAALTGFDPRGIQKVALELPVNTPLAIVEAETGSGKTEAALVHFARLRSAGLVDGLYFAVPTRAAAGQLFLRIQATMERIGGPEAILAVPGQLRAGEAEGCRLPGFEVRWDDDGVHWAAEHATRFLAAPIAVGTVDQVLMAGLKVRHAHLRGAALSRSLLVIDEVHASDEYMNRIARQVDRDHRALGGHTLLMSATLGSAARAEWLGRSRPDFDTAISAPFPAVWTTTSQEPITTNRDDANDRQKRVTPRLEPTMDADEAARIALGAANQGARVLVVRNTVDKAVETFRALAAEAPERCLAVEGVPTLHHSRFAAEDRQALDRAIEAVFGKASNVAGVVAVGTQTLEQSLDIDADLLVTDLCPMDVLLQRIGRLHRHQRPRPPGFEEAAVHILCPQSGLDSLASDMRFENGLGAWQKASGSLAGIYSDLRIVEATRRLASERPLWTIPTDNRALVEGATHPDRLEAIEAEMGWQDYTTRVMSRDLADRQHAGMLVLDRSQGFPESFPDAEETVRTRLGDQGPVLELPPGTIGPFGHAITRLTPPAHWCHGLSGEEPVDVEPAEGGLVIAVAGKCFRYDREGLKKIEAEA